MLKNQMQVKKVYIYIHKPKIGNNDSIWQVIAAPQSKGPVETLCGSSMYTEIYFSLLVKKKLKSVLFLTVNKKGI